MMINNSGLLFGPPRRYRDSIVHLYQWQSDTCWAGNTPSLKKS